MKKDCPTRNQVDDFFRFFFKLKRRYPKNALIVVKIDLDYVLFNEDAQALAKVGRVRLHPKGDGVLYADRPKYFEEYRPALEAAGHRLVYAEENNEGFQVKSSPEGWLEAPAPLCGEEPEWALLPAAPRPRRKKAKPEYVQRPLDLDGVQRGNSETP